MVSSSLHILDFFFLEGYSELIDWLQMSMLLLLILFEYDDDDDDEILIQMTNVVIYWLYKQNNFKIWVGEVDVRLQFTMMVMIRTNWFDSKEKKTIWRNSAKQSRKF